MPTYHAIGDHAESIQIDFDPSRISYADLLDVFWHSHSPLRPAWKRQYMSAIFTHDATQQRLAEATREREAQRLGSEIHTEIAPAGPFTLAEDYHQKYMLRRAGNLLIELQAMLPRLEDLVASTAVARINGFLGGCGDLEDFRQELDSYGLSPDAKRVLVKLVEQKHRARL